MFDNVAAQLFGAFVAPIVIGQIFKFVIEWRAVAKQNVAKLPKWLSEPILKGIAEAEIYLKGEEGKAKLEYAIRLVASQTKNKYDDVVLEGLIRKAFEQIKQPVKK